MRISYLFNSSIHSSNPGSIQVANMCAAMSILSHDVNLITPATGLNVPFSKFYGLKNSTKIKKIKIFKRFPLGINYYLFSIASIIYGIFIKTDLFITRNFFTLFLLILIKKKVIIEIHHDLSSEGRVVKLLYKIFDVLNNKNIIKVIAITSGVKQYLIKELKVKPKKIQILSSVSGLKFKFKILKKKKSLKVGYFGSLDKSKGSDFIVKLAKIDKKNNYFIFGGNSKDVKELNCINKSSNLKISKSIEYGKLNKYISSMDVLIMPSNIRVIRSLGGIGNISKYTSPMKIFDYLASGKLIIASDVRVYREILQHDKNCILIKKLNILLWLRTLNYIQYNLKKINKIKRNAFNLSKKYTYSLRAKKLLENCDFHL